MKGLLRYFMVVFLFCGCFADPGTPAEGSEPPPSMSAFLARDYGYFLGDLVEVSYTVSLPLDEYLNADSLPKRDETLEGWVEVRRVKIRESLRRHRRVYRLSFVYQVFRPADALHAKAIPQIDFLYGPKGKPSGYASALPRTTPLLVSTLTKEGAGFKPTMYFSWNSSSQRVIRAIGTALLFGSSLFLLLHLVSRRAFRAESPFAAGLKDLSRKSDPAAALVIFRLALNEKARMAIFRHNLTAFFEAFPGARIYEKEVQELVSVSDEISFNPERRRVDDDLVQRITWVMRNLKRRERWK